MGWYDLFSSFYDRSLEPLYVDARRAAAEALALEPGLTVMDLPTGTGQSLDGLVAGVGEGGRVVGSDLSQGMLRKAEQRVERNGWTTVYLVKADVREVSLQGLALDRPVDRLHVFLGMTTFPEPEAAFERLWGLLAPGGRCVVVDVHDPQPGFQGKMVNLLARADIRRRFWEPLERVSGGFERVDLPSKKEHGGQLMLATGVKPSFG